MSGQWTQGLILDCPLRQIDGDNKDDQDSGPEASQRSIKVQRTIFLTKRELLPRKKEKTTNGTEIEKPGTQRMHCYLHVHVHVPRVIKYDKITVLVVFWKWQTYQFYFMEYKSPYCRYQKMYMYMHIVDQNCWKKLNFG